MNAATKFPIIHQSREVLICEGSAVHVRYSQQGNFTAAEYYACFGAEANLVRDLGYETYTREGWTIQISMADVLACESGRTMQRALIDALREREELPALTYEQISELALDYDTISPRAALFLLQMFDHAYSPEEVDIHSELRRLDQQGLGLKDFCKT